jgi:hypothetical protein
VDILVTHLPAVIRDFADYLDTAGFPLQVLELQDSPGIPVSVD